MMKFFFHICTTGEMVRDKRGRTLADIVYAKKLAIRYARLLKAKSTYKQIDFRVIEIMEEGGRLAATIKFERTYPGRDAPVTTLYSTAAGSLKSTTTSNRWKSTGRQRQSDTPRADDSGMAPAGSS
jgi:hypothetical protein